MIMRREMRSMRREAVVSEGEGPPLTATGKPFKEWDLKLEF